MVGGGRHMVQFTTVRKGDDMLFGLIRADWDVEGGENANWVEGHCFYYTDDGKRYPDDSEWEGMQTAMEEGDRIGLLLDLDAGSLTVYKNDERLGVMQESGLTDAAGYRWAVALASKGDSARICRWRRGKRTRRACCAHGTLPCRRHSRNSVTNVGCNYTVCCILNSRKSL